MLLSERAPWSHAPVTLPRNSPSMVSFKHGASNQSSFISVRCMRCRPCLLGLPACSLGALGTRRSQRCPCLSALMFRSSTKHDIPCLLSFLRASCLPRRVTLHHAHQRQSPVLCDGVTNIPRPSTMGLRSQHHLPSLVGHAEIYGLCMCSRQIEKAPAPLWSPKI